MALFKILKGSSEALKNVKATEGYAYFTPDDGKFYIDVASTDDAAAVVVGDEQTAENGVNRICINSIKGLSSLNPSYIDAGIEELDSSTVIYDCNIPAGTATEDIILIECN